MSTPNFLDVTACLRSQQPEEVPESVPISLAVRMMASPGLATMSTSQVIRDEATGATYLDSHHFHRKSGT